MKRSKMLEQLHQKEPWDVIIVGGGATGLGCAVESASRGYRTLLVEQSDFGKGTSSRSTKLVHGGVRYLKQGNISLVREALKERGLLLRNAPHITSRLGFVIPRYKWWDGIFYGTGLKIYDALAGGLNLGSSRWLSRQETLEHIPTLSKSGLRGGVLYYDGQFDDTRLAITLAWTAADLGACLVNYCQVTGLLRKNGRISGVALRDLVEEQKYELPARVVVNATGVLTDQVRQMEDSGVRPLVRASQGAHIVLNHDFLPGRSALMVPRTEDGRVLFAIPWQQRTLIGTTDIPVEQALLEPKPMSSEIEFLLGHAAQYLERKPGLEDVLSTFAGLRPLVSSPDGAGETASLSRDHSVLVSKGGLVTITGGKWTTYRKMAQDTIDSVEEVGRLGRTRSDTEELRLHAAPRDLQFEDGRPLARYGSDAFAIEAIAREDTSLAVQLCPELPYIAAEVIWAVRHEMAITVEDVLSRRTRALILDARAAIRCAPKVARLMSKELKEDSAWVETQVQSFQELARGYLPAPGEGLLRNN